VNRSLRRRVPSAPSALLGAASSRASLVAVLALAAAAAFGGCSESEPEKAPAPAPAAKPPEPPPAIDEAVKKQMDADMAEARTLVEQARELKKKGLELERAGPAGAGKPSFNQAATLYTQAHNKMGKWCEVTAKDVTLTAEQRRYYVNPLAAERQGWLGEAATLGPLLQR
jgi:hypothetical protein